MKTKILLVALVIAGTPNNSFAQPATAWVKTMGGSGTQTGKALTVDASGNVYTTGNFSLTVDFDPGPGIFSLSSVSNSYDIFISKLDNTGNFIWAKAIGGINSDKGSALAADASGNIYVTGTFRATADFDPGAGIFNLTSSGLDDIFILKLDASGNFVWAKSIGGPTNDSPSSIAIDATGNVYTAGTFTGTVDFDPGVGTLNLTSSGGEDIFISKLDSSGNHIWAKIIGGTSNDAGTLVLDASANIYMTGGFRGTVDFDPGPGTFNLSSVLSGPDIFISKLDNSGAFVWAKRIGGGDSDGGTSIALDPSGNIYTTGTFDGSVASVDFDPGAATFDLTGGAGSTTIFISKLNNSGNFVWAKAMTASTLIAQYYNSAQSIICDASGDVYTTGYFSGTTDFDPGTGTFNLPTSGLTDIFISKLTSSGNFVWAKAIGGSARDESYSMVIDPSHNLYITGYYLSPTVNFDSILVTNPFGNAGVFQVYIAKLKGCALPPAIIQTSGNTIICSGTSVTLSANTGTGLTYKWKLNGNAISGATSSTYSATSGGSYACAVTNGCGSTTSNLISVIVNTSTPSSTITAAGPVVLCNGDVVYLNASIGTGISYQWKNNAVPISGATTSSYLVNSAGTYTCVETNGCGNTTSNSISVTVNQCLIRLNLRMYLAGFYQGGGLMRSPLYNISLSNDPTACDSITVELHSSTSPYSTIATSRGLLRTNGNAVLTFPYSIRNSSYYIVVRHRRSLGVWSRNPVLFTYPSVSFDFTRL